MGDLVGREVFYATGDLPWRTVPKKRPRFDPRSSRAYTDPAYREWLNQAAELIRYTVPATLTTPGILRVEFTPESCRWELASCYAPAKRGVRGDVDNLAGSVMDALQQGGALSDDGLVRRLEATIL